MLSKPVVAGLQRNLDQRLEKDALRAQLRSYRAWLRLAAKLDNPGPAVPGYASGGSVKTTPRELQQAAKLLKAAQDKVVGELPAPVQKRLLASGWTTTPIWGNEFEYTRTGTVFPTSGLNESEAQRSMRHEIAHAILSAYGVPGAYGPEGGQGRPDVQHQLIFGAQDFLGNDPITGLGETLRYGRKYGVTRIPVPPVIQGPNGLVPFVSEDVPLPEDLLRDFGMTYSVPQAAPRYQYGGEYDLLGFSQHQPTQQYTDKELAYMRAVYNAQNPNRGFDVIPGRTPPAPAFTVQEDTLGPTIRSTAARLNPAAAQYEDQRAVDPAMRPSNAWEQTKRWGRQQKAKEALATAALAKLSDADRQAVSVLAEELQRNGVNAGSLQGYFKRRGRGRQQTGMIDEPVEFALNAARERLQLIQEKQREVDIGKSPELAVQELAGTLQEQTQGNIHPTESPLGEPNTFKAFTARSVVPDAALERVADVPVIGKPLASAIQGSTTPLAIAAGARFGGGLPGLARNTAAITGAGAVTAPLGPVPQQIAMTAADIAVGGGGSTRRVNIPEGRLDVWGAIGDSAVEIPVRGGRVHIDAQRPSILAGVTGRDVAAADARRAVDEFLQANPHAKWDGTFTTVRENAVHVAEPTNLEPPRLGTEPPPTRALSPDVPGPASARAPSPEEVEPGIFAEAPTPPLRPAMAGGAPITNRYLASLRGTPAPTSFTGRVRNVASALNVLRGNPEVNVVRDAQRRLTGGLNDMGVDVTNLRNDLYRDAAKGGFRINQKAAKQSDAVLDLMDRAWNRAGAGTFPPRSQAVAQKIYDSLDEDAALMLQVEPGFEERMLPDYFPHLFASESKVAGVGGGAPVRKPFFLRKRTLQGSLADALEIKDPQGNITGYRDLKNWDPVDFTIQHRLATINYVLGKQYWEELKQAGVVRSAVKRLPGDKPLADILPAAISKAYLKTNAAGEASIGHTGGYWASPKVAKALKDYWGASAFTEAPLKQIMQTRNGLFRIKVLGGGFQVLDLSQRSLGMAVGRATPVAGLPHPLEAITQAAAVPKALVAALVPGADSRFMRMLGRDELGRAVIRNGAAAGRDPSFADRQLAALVSEVPGGNAAKRFAHFITSDAYDRFHKWIVVEAAKTEAKAYLRRGMGLEEAARRGAEDANIFMSSIPEWQSVFRAPTVRDAMRLTFFGPGEVEAWWRIPFKALSSAHGREFASGLALMTIASAEMINKMVTGHYMTPEQLTPWKLDEKQWEDFKQRGWEALPGILAEVDTPFLEYNTKFMRPEIGTGPDGRKLYLDMLGQADTPFRWAFSPGFALQGRLGQIPRTGIDVWEASHGRAPPFGEKVESPADVARFAGQELSPIAIAGLAGTERGRIGGLGAGLQTGGLNVSAEPIGERRDRAIAQEYQAGNLKGHYDGVPTYSDISQVPEDLAYFKEKYPNLTTERSQAFQEETVGGLSESEQRAASKQRFDQAKQTKVDAYEELKRDVASARGGPHSDQRVRAAYAEGIKNTNRNYQAVLRNEHKLNPDSGDFKPSSFEARTLDKYYGWLEALPEVPLEADWDAFDAKYDTLTQAEKDVIEKQTGINDLPTEATYAAFNRGLQKYRDLPPDDKNSKKRENLRKSDPWIDGMLWALGITSKVMSPSHRQAAVDAYGQLYGTQIPLSEVSLGATKTSSSSGTSRNTRLS